MGIVIEEEHKFLNGIVIPSYYISLSGDIFLKKTPSGKYSCETGVKYFVSKEKKDEGGEFFKVIRIPAFEMDLSELSSIESIIYEKAKDLLPSGNDV